MTITKNIVYGASRLSGMVLILMAIITCERFEPNADPYLFTGDITAQSRDTFLFEGAFLNIGKDKIKQHGFCWSDSQNPSVGTDTSTRLGVKSTTGPFTSTVSGFRVNTTYYVRSYSSADAGTSYGEQKSFTTPAAGLPVVNTTAISGITRDSAVSDGNVIDDGGSPVSARGVCWDTTGTPTIENHVTTDGNGTGSFTSLLTGLSCQTTYHVRAYATNAEGTSYGNTISFETSSCRAGLPELKTAAPSGITMTEAMCGGNITHEGESPVSERGICWATTSDPTISDSNIPVGTGIGEFAGSLTGLDPNSSYYVRAYASNEGGTAYGDQVFVRTMSGIVTDIDGNEYYTVGIGEQTWMAENLNVTRFADGSDILHVENELEWEGMGDTAKAYCLQENSTSFGEEYGALYSWTAAMRGVGSSNVDPSGVQGVCPDGWHLPSDPEWKELEVFLGMSQEQSDSLQMRGDIGGKLRESGTNISGFTALPGGLRNKNGEFRYLDELAVFWTATIYDETTGQVLNRYLNSTSDMVGRNYVPRKRGQSVRCVQDDGTPTIPAVSTSQVINIGEHSANPGGEVHSDGGSTITASGVCWSTNRDPGISDNVTTDGPGSGPFTSTLSGLDLFTRFYVRAYATNSNGTAYGEVVTFRTLWDFSTVSDIDGNVYNTQDIGDQVWMARNLSTTQYADGTAILHVENETEWDNLDFTQKAYCWYENNSGNINSYGALYTWAAACNGDSSKLNPSGLQGICPDGWHLPSDEEWKSMEKALGMSWEDADLVGHRGNNEGDMLKETGNDRWGGSNAGATNEIGFNGLPNGQRDFYGVFNYLGYVAPIWTSTNYSSTLAWIRALHYDDEKISRNPYTKSNGYAVRCVMDQ